MGLPTLASMFYYGKEFGSQKQKLNKQGEIIEEEYHPLSVTDFGEEAWQQEVARGDKTDENDLDALIGRGLPPATVDDLMQIVGRG